MPSVQNHKPHLNKKMKQTGLGRGLDALISMDDTPDVLTTDQTPSSINEIDIVEIHPNREQPRREFTKESLEELAESIRHIGVIQPITLRLEEDGTYMIIAGERRYRAAAMAGLTSIPAYVRKVSDEAVMEMALIENIQREDLNDIEVALAYQHLMTRNNLTQEEVSRRVGKSRATVANFVRLLRLPADIQLALKDRRLSNGHARALLGIEDPEQQVALYKYLTQKGLSVRQTESLVRDFNEGRILDFNEMLANTEDFIKKGGKKRPKMNSDAFMEMSEHLTSAFGSQVKIECNEEGKGKIAISFANDEELQHVISKLEKILAQ